MYRMLRSTDRERQFGKANSDTEEGKQFNGGGRIRKWEVCIYIIKLIINLYKINGVEREWEKGR